MRLLNDGQGPVAEIARKRGIPRNRPYKWQKEVALHGGAFPGSGGQVEPAAELEPFRCEARDEKKGLCADPQPVPPWEWRHIGPVAVDVGDLVLGEHVTREGPSWPPSLRCTPPVARRLPCSHQ